MAVVALLSIGQGAQASIIGQIQGIGANLVFVTPGQVQQGGVATAASAATLTLEDAEAIAATVPNVAAMAPEYSRNAQVVYREQRSRHQPGGHADVDPLRDPATGRRRLCGAGG